MHAAQIGRSDWAEFDRKIAAAQKLMLANPNDAMRAAQNAAALANRYKQSPHYRRAAATALWLEAEALMRTSRLPEARIAVNQAEQFAADDKTVTKFDGDLALTHARIAESSGDFADALRSYQRAHAIFLRIGVPRSQALALLGLGDLYGKARDFNREIRYYGEAVRTYSGDRTIAFAAANNLGFAYQQMGHYDQSIPFFDKALSTAVLLKSPLLQANILDNLAVSYARLQRLPEAEHAARRSLSLMSKKGEAEETRSAWGAQAEIAYRRGDFDAAVANLQQAFRDLDVKKTTPIFRDIHEIAYKVYRKIGNLPLAIAHLAALKRLDDQGRSLAASANLALLAAQFDFATQDLEIEHLKSAKLERDIKLRKSQAETGAVVFASVIVAAILLFGWIAWRHTILSQHRNTIEQKNTQLVKTLAERDSEIQRRTAVETHLRDAVQVAEQANRAKSHFLANMSHELRTPLNAIIGFSELMLVRSMKSDDVRDYAGDILEAGRHLLAVLNNILDLARIESGKVDLEGSIVRLGDVVHYALSVLGGLNARTGKAFSVSGEMDLLVHVDEVRLRQVIINLLSNAVKFTKEGDSIDIRIDRVEGGVDIAVEDSGQGIPADKLSSIMEPFVQADSSYARSHGGSGLGLAIVKSLVELHGGSFAINSEHGKGTIARLHLPEERLVEPGSANIPKRVEAYRSIRPLPAA